MVAIAIIASIFVVGRVPASAQYMSQLEEKSLPVGDFTGINVTDDFEVNLSKGECSVKVTADKALLPYVQVYVRAKVLYITYDQRAVPKDVRKMFKSGRNSVKPVFRAQVSLPLLDGIELSENATVMAADIFDGQKTEITLTDKTSLKNLSLYSGSVAVNLKKNAQAALTLQAVNQIDVRMEGNTNLKLTAQAHDLVMNLAGQAELACTGTAENANLTTAGTAKASLDQKGSKLVIQMGASSDISLAGEGESLSIRGERNADLEAGAYTAQLVDATMSGSSQANVNVVEQLDATLIGGSALYYTGTPVFKIGKIIKSTLAPYGSSAK